MLGNSPNSFAHVSSTVYVDFPFHFKAPIWEVLPTESGSGRAAPVSLLHHDPWIDTRGIYSRGHDSFPQGSLSHLASETMQGIPTQAKGHL